MTNRKCEQLKCGFLIMGICRKCEQCGAVPLIVNENCDRCWNCEHDDGILRWDDNVEEKKVKEVEKPEKEIPLIGGGKSK